MIQIIRTLSVIPRFFLFINQDFIIELLYFIKKHFHLILIFTMMIILTLFFPREYLFLIIITS